MITTVTKIYDIDSVHYGYKLDYDNGTSFYVPLDTSNRHYQEIQDWIAAGNSVVDPNAE